MSTKERRSLVEGLAVDPDVKQLEEAFVYGASRRPTVPDAPNDTTETIAPRPAAETAGQPRPSPHPDRILPQMMSGRIPVTTRCRPEVASALKRASLQRQLDGIEPHYVQDIMEEALEGWLRDHGYGNI